ncbi:hypothetical protein A0H81_02797 [Grifola frondosa]|uniref:Uncharacterized protein n=1 Tax=Grifola frondosa TaxID=5627 RepID=A0A1C7MKE8_GRIFR|nr:hypothetical protein A0H81_02797 [Grifola frondosa]
MAARSDTVEMIASRAVPSHAEVFNTYGDVSIAQRSSRYGFTLEDGEAAGAMFWRSELDVAQLGTLLDNLPPDRPKTRLAVAHVLWERMLLESCAAASEVQSALDGSALGSAERRVHT